MNKRASDWIQDEQDPPRRQLISTHVYICHTENNTLELDTSIVFILQEYRLLQLRVHFLN